MLVIRKISAGRSVLQDLEFISVHRVYGIKSRTNSVKKCFNEIQFTRNYFIKHEKTNLISRTICLALYKQS